MIDFNLQFKPTVETVSMTRRFVTSLFERALHDPDGAARVGIAVHELLENVLKYSASGAASLRVCVTPEDLGCVTTIETANPVTPERRAGLEEFFAEVARAPDAFAFYHAAMQRSRTLRFGSGLGLARIWAEAEMTIALHLGGDGATVRATGLMLARGKEAA